MWRKRAHALALLTKLCSTKVKLKWISVWSNAFIDMNKIVGRDVLLSNPNFSKRLQYTRTLAKRSVGEYLVKMVKPSTFTQKINSGGN